MIFHGSLAPYAFRIALALLVLGAIAVLLGQVAIGLVFFAWIPLSLIAGLRARRQRSLDP